MGEGEVEREKTFGRKVPLTAKLLMEGLPTEMVREDRLLTENIAYQRRFCFMGLVKAWRMRT